MSSKIWDCNYYANLVIFFLAQVEAEISFYWSQHILLSDATTFKCLGALDLELYFYDWKWCLKIAVVQESGRVQDLVIGGYSSRFANKFDKSDNCGIVFFFFFCYYQLITHDFYCTAFYWRYHTVKYYGTDLLLGTSLDGTRTSGRYPDLLAVPSILVVPLRMFWLKSQTEKNRLNG